MVVQKLPPALCWVVIFHALVLAVWYWEEREIFWSFFLFHQSWFLFSVVSLISTPGAEHSPLYPSPWNRFWTFPFCPSLYFIYFIYFIASEAWPWTSDPSVSTSQVVGLQVHATMLALCSAEGQTEAFVHTSLPSKLHPHPCVPPSKDFLPQPLNYCASAVTDFMG